MNRTVNDIANRIKRKFGDESAVQVTDSDILLWLNDAIMELVNNDAASFVTIKYTSYIEGQNTYNIMDYDPMPVNVRSIAARGGVGTSYRTLQRLDPGQFGANFSGTDDGPWGSSEDKGTPSAYTFLSATQFKVYPSPSQTDGLGFCITYTSYPAELTSMSDCLPTHPSSYKYLEEYCMLQAYEMDEDWAAAERKAAFVQSYLTENYANAQNQGDSYPVIRTTGG